MDGIAPVPLPNLVACGIAMFAIAFVAIGCEACPAGLLQPTTTMSMANDVNIMGRVTSILCGLW